jgi:hypothetical protein
MKPDPVFSISDYPDDSSFTDISLMRHTIHIAVINKYAYVFSGTGYNEQGTVKKGGWVNGV